MEGRAESSHATRGDVHNTGQGDRSPAREEESEEAQSSNKYRRIDRDGVRASSIPQQAGRFLFVDSSSSGQRPRSDQRAINAHIQQTAHRNRKQATRRQKTTAAANIGRYRREPLLQPRPVEPQRIVIDSADLDQRRSSGAGSFASFESSSVASSTFSIRSESRTPEPQALERSRSPPGFEQEQLDRLRHYSSVRGPEVRDAVNAQHDEQATSTEIVRRANPAEETTSVRSMLTQILQRLDAGHARHSITGAPNLSLQNTALDPFNISSVHITPSMNSALRHCKLSLFSHLYFPFCGVPVCLAANDRLFLDDFRVRRTWSLGIPLMALLCRSVASLAQ